MVPKNGMETYLLRDDVLCSALVRPDFTCHGRGIESGIDLQPPTSLLHRVSAILPMLSAGIDRRNVG